METCPNSSSYEPSSLVSAFHNVPHIDINLNQNVTEFENTLDYYETIIIWACVPILAAVCIFILMSIYFICVCCCCCCQQHEERSKCSKATCGSFVVLLIVLGLACCGVALWAEFTLDSHINDSSEAASTVNSAIQDALSTAQSLNSSQVQAEVMALVEAMSNSSLMGLPNYDDALAATTAISSQSASVQDAFNNIQSEVNAPDFSSLLDTVDFVELARHWTVVAYVIVTIVILFLMLLSVCCGALCGNPICMTLALVLLGVYTLTMWIAVGGNLGYLIIAGDICNDPDRLISTQLTDASQEQLRYYLVCNESCYANPFMDYQMSADEALETIQMEQTTVMQFVANQSVPMVEETLSAVVATFDSAVSAIDNITVLTNCSTTLNPQYLEMLDGLCGDGYLFSLILFAMACGLAIFFILILCFGSFYAGLLSKGRTFDDETIVYDFPNEDGPSPWQSYGTQQQRYHNTQSQYNYNNESFNMASAPHPEPPKYTDLHQESHMNGNTNTRVSGNFDNLS